MRDLFNILKATKEDIGGISERLDTLTNETNAKIQHIQTSVEAVTLQSSENSDRIDRLEASIEQIKQDQLRNNLCISGVPPEMINGNNTAELVIQIARKLNVELAKGQFSSYAIVENKFIIARFFNIKHKQQLHNKVRAKRSLMVEEVFDFASNSQIYLNDHLTPHMNKLFLIARKAKFAGHLASVSSLGGKIRAKKRASDAPTVIVSEKQLQTLIQMDDSVASVDSIQLVDELFTSNTLSSSSTSHTTQTQHNTQSKRIPAHNKQKTNNTRNPRQQKTKTSKPKSNEPGTSAQSGNAPSTAPKGRTRKRKATVDSDSDCEHQAEKHSKK